jgi:two-component system OmpR family sensor kinase
VRRTLVGRMALVQLVVVLGALGAMLALSFVAVTFVLTRSWDQGLRALGEVGTRRAERRASRGQDVRWVMQEMEEHRPIGVRIELQDDGGNILAADGKGPRLSANRSGCRNQDDWRVCEARAAGLRILTAISRAQGLADRDLFLGASAVIALALALAAVASSRLITRRTLTGLSTMATGIAALQPGAGQRVAPGPGYQELDLLAGSFNELLGRVEEALASERRFAAEASHELKTPLTVLRGEVEELTRGEPPDGPAGRALAAVDGLIRLVEALLWLARSQGPIERSALDVVNLADLAREEAARVAAAHPARPMQVQAPDEVLVAADERLLARAVANLVDNAFKHAPAGTPVRVALAEHAGLARLEVEDAGPGIPPEQRTRVFEPFYRGGVARSQSEGFGLGLPLAHAVARALGGSLTIEPLPVGTRFVLAIPSPPDLGRT